MFSMRPAFALLLVSRISLGLISLARRTATCERNEFARVVASIDAEDPLFLGTRIVECPSRLRYPDTFFSLIEYFSRGPPSRYPTSRNCQQGAFACMCSGGGTQLHTTISVSVVRDSLRPLSFFAVFLGRRALCSRCFIKNTSS